MSSSPPKTNIKWNMDRRIYIGNMGDGANKEEILDVCSKFGAVKHVWVARKPAGFAFVEFFDKRAAEEAAGELDETWINGHKVCVEMSTGEPKFTADGRLRVGNSVRRSPTIFSQITSRQRHNLDNRRPMQTSRINDVKRSNRDCRDSSCACHCHCRVRRKISPGPRWKHGSRSRERQSLNGDRSQSGRQDRRRPKASYRSQSRSSSRSSGRRSRHSGHSDDRSSRSGSRDNHFGQRRSRTLSGDRSRLGTNVLKKEMTTSLAAPNLKSNDPGVEWNSPGRDRHYHQRLDHYPAPPLKTPITP